MYNDDDKITGQWVDDSGESFAVHFGKVWRGHEWTDEEAQDLLAGKKVKVNLTSKSGKPYTMLASLGHQQFTNSDGKLVKGIWVDGEFEQKEPTIPDSFLGYTFSDAEKEDLKNGESIHCEGLTSKAGNKFDANLKWGDKTWKGHTMKGLIMSFDD